MNDIIHLYPLVMMTLVFMYGFFKLDWSLLLLFMCMLFNYFIYKFIKNMKNIQCIKDMNVPYIKDITISYNISFSIMLLCYLLLYIINNNNKNSKSYIVYAIFIIITIMTFITLADTIPSHERNDILVSIVYGALMSCIIYTLINALVYKNNVIMSSYGYVLIPMIIFMLFTYIY